MTPSTLSSRTDPSRRQTLVLAAVVVMALLVSACASSGTSADAEQSAPPAESESDIMDTDADGVTAVDEQRLESELEPLSASTLSDSDIAGLVFMREEEKLALDVYNALYETWSIPIFDNISRAEQTHTNSVKTLLDRWEITDPAVDQPAGVFANTELQTLYDDLVAQGNRSIVDALIVGATIEELDISDLRERASEEPAIDLVYANLEKGSRNHLRAFVAQLEEKGGTYTPVYLSQADYDEIVSSPTERGRGK